MFASLLFYWVFRGELHDIGHMGYQKMKSEPTRVWNLFHLSL